METGTIALLLRPQRDGRRCLNEVRSWRPEQFGDLAALGFDAEWVSMKSGLGDRNNQAAGPPPLQPRKIVSMKSGLGDRNNDRRVLSRRCAGRVSMKSGLGDRNNGLHAQPRLGHPGSCLNEVRSWRPEQSAGEHPHHHPPLRLNEVRSWRPEQYPNEELIQLMF